MKKDAFAWRLMLGVPPGLQRELVPAEMREFSVFTENGVEHRVWPDRYYSDEYADKIMKRANDPNAFVPIEIKLAK